MIKSAIAGRRSTRDRLLHGPNVACRQCAHSRSFAVIEAAPESGSPLLTHPEPSRFASNRSAPSVSIGIPMPPSAFQDTQAGDDRPEEASQLILQLPKRRWLHRWRRPTQKARPEAALLCYCGEGVGQAHRHVRRHHSLTAPQRAADCLDNASQVERESAGSDPCENAPNSDPPPTSIRIN